MKKVELLAPAGNYESFLGAIHAGADAIYLGGNKFGARAFADNFSEEEVISAIRYAHVYGRKVYLTLNTLIKEREFGEIYDYLKPFYESGLDGVIIQDLGVFHAVGRWFPDLERHISTQMTVTGAYGAALLKELGAVRIVPARELTLEEIRQIKEKTDIEIETFVHGAICYCYSGQCLFSSILGGRSGNRGRCAQPCRLPYTINKEQTQDKQQTQDEQQYPLSLKDMCTIEILPELIEAGIDSFKIEGRMKSPEYAAGVTALYRKYIDRYYSNPEAVFRVEKQDMEKLRALYIRSEISTGYYHRHNGREMITLENPGYAGRNEALAAAIRTEYLDADFRLPITGEVILKKGKAAEYTVSYGESCVTAKGEIVQQAQKQPLTEENILKQLRKNGNTPFILKDIVINRDEDIFMPVKALNDLRRNVCELLEEKIIMQNGLSYSERQENPKKILEEKREAIREEKEPKRKKLHVLVSTKEQLETALENVVERIYIPSHMIKELLSGQKKAETEFYLTLPYIIRKQDKAFLQEMEVILKQDIVSGVLVRNLEEIEWLKQIGCHKDIVLDQNLYIWNREARKIMKHMGTEHYISSELNIHEIRELLKDTKEMKSAIVIYGRIPMMLSANCVAATGKKCKKKPAYMTLTDRYNKTFPVFLNCNHCYNVIYNSLPLSHHQNLEQIKETGIYTFRLDFTTETENDVDTIIKYFKKKMISDTETPPYKEYTRGHLKRGVE